MLKTFKARIHGAFPTTEGNQVKIDDTLVFTKYKIRLKENQINRIYLDPLLVQLITDRMSYEFDKKLNKDDNKMFSIIIPFKGEEKTYHLDISLYNKIKANIVHKRYWVHQNIDWIFKAVVTTVIGALIALLADQRGLMKDT